MARKRKFVMPVMTIEQEIQMQGIRSLLEAQATQPIDPASPAGAQLAQRFMIYLGTQREERFMELVRDFALSQVEEAK